MSVEQESESERRFKEQVENERIQNEYKKWYKMFCGDEKRNRKLRELFRVDDEKDEGVSKLRELFKKREGKRISLARRRKKKSLSEFFQPLASSTQTDTSIFNGQPNQTEGK